MEFSEIKKQALAIGAKYRANGKDWGAAEYTQGFMKDLGDLAKLVMIKNGYREGEGDIDEKLQHELADCLWSVIMIADKLDIDLEKAFAKTMKELEGRFE